jgi:hypothetical protein
MGEDERFLVKRCLSDGNIINEGRTTMSAVSSKQRESISHKGFVSSNQATHIISESSPDMPTASDVGLSRCTPSMPSTHYFGDAQKVQHNGSSSNYLSEQDDMSSVSNFVDVDWLSSSENLCENDQYRSSALTRYSTAETSSSENIISEAKQSTPAKSEGGSSSRKEVLGRSPYILPGPKPQHGKEPMGSEMSVHTKIRDDFPDSFKQWVAYGEAICH